MKLHAQREKLALQVEVAGGVGRSEVLAHDAHAHRPRGLARGQRPQRVEPAALRLGDTDCVIPTFAEALEALGGRVPLLLEVKRGHNNRRLCALTLAALRTYGGPYCVESFDPTIVAWFRRNAPDILRGQLSQPPKDYGKALNKPAAAIVGNVLTNVIARPQFIAYKIGPKPLSVRLCEAMGAARAGWTSRAWTHERDYDIVIFEHYRPGAWFRADI